MSKNYFTVERNDQFLENVAIANQRGELAFAETLDMSYDEIKNYEHISDFISCIMDATNTRFKSDDDQTVVTLIDEEDVFIWSIIIGPGENEDELKYVLVDWHKDGKKYRYAKNETE